LKLTGYPRDTDVPEDSDILNVLVSVLKTTVESTPNTFKGPSSALFKAIINKPKDIKKETLNFLTKGFIPKFKAQLVLAKERYDAVPQIEESTNVISLPIIPVDQKEYEPSEEMGAEELASECTVYSPQSFISCKALPVVTQEPLELRKTGISDKAEKIISTLEVPDEIEFSDADIARNIKIGFPKEKKLQKIDTFLKNKDTDGVAILALLNRLLDILSFNEYSIDTIVEFRDKATYARTNINAALLVSAAKGLIYQLFQEISKDGNSAGLITIIGNAIQRDLSMTMLLLTFDEAEKQNIELKAKERETFKMRMRQMDDTQRQITKMLLDIGLAGYIITNEDREFFAQEYNINENEKVELDPEEGEDGDAPQDYEDDALRVASDGHEIEGGNGGYGENFNELTDYNIGGQFLDGEGNSV
jgi:hypothetical protein